MHVVIMSLYIFLLSLRFCRKNEILLITRDSILEKSEQFDIQRTKNKIKPQLNLIYVLLIV